MRPPPGSLEFLDTYEIKLIDGLEFELSVGDASQLGLSGTSLLFFLFCFHFTGAKVPDVEQMVENHLETLIIKHFDPKKADSIFSAEGEVGVHCLWVNQQGCPLYLCSPHLYQTGQFLDEFSEQQAISLVASRQNQAYSAVTGVMG